MFMIIVLTSFVFFLILRRPPRSTRTDTRFPYTTLFRSVRHGVDRGIKYVASRACRYQVSDSEVSIRRLNRTVSDTFGVRHQIGRHTSELQSLMRISYAVFCLKKKKKIEDTLLTKQNTHHNADNN